MPMPINPILLQLDQDQEVEFKQSQSVTLSLNESQKGWEVGQLVQWGGVAGKIMRINNKIRVKFINHMVRDFFIDGRYEEWHIESSLKPITEQELQSQAVAYSKSRK